jgi:hypothetical protein
MDLSSGSRPWVHGELPWLRGPMYRVHVDGMPEVGSFLDRWAYQRILLDGRRMTSSEAAFVELARAFGIQLGRNRDAFDDWFCDFVEDHEGQRFAVLWSDVEYAASVAPMTTIEVGWALLECAWGHWPNFAPGTDLSIELDIFAVGTGAEFSRPGVTPTVTRGPEVQPGDPER